MRARLAQEPFRKAALVAWQTDELEGVFAHYLGNDALTRNLAEGQEALISTDDRSFMEFAIARTVGRRELVPIRGMLRAGATAMKMNRPHVSSGTVNWERVEEQRMIAAATTRTSCCRRR